MTIDLLITKGGAFWHHLFLELILKLLYNLVEQKLFELFLQFLKNFGRLGGINIWLWMIITLFEARVEALPEEVVEALALVNGLLF